MNEMQLEQKFHKAIKKKYRTAFYYKIKDCGGLGGMRCFDAFCIIDGFVFAFEFKIEPNKLTKYQKAQFNLVMAARGITMKVTDENFESCLGNIGILLKLSKEDIGSSYVLQQEKKKRKKYTLKKKGGEK